MKILSRINRLASIIYDRSSLAFLNFEAPYKAMARKLLWAFDGIEDCFVHEYIINGVYGVTFVYKTKQIRIAQLDEDRLLVEVVVGAENKNAIVETLASYHVSEEYENCYTRYFKFVLGARRIGKSYDNLVVAITRSKERYNAKSNKTV